MTRLTMTTLGTIVLWVLAGPAGAQLVPPASDEIKLQVTRQEFDEDAAGRPEAAHVELVAKQFKADPQIVQGLRAAKQSWGEVAVRLVLAQELLKAKPDLYPNLAQAVQKIGGLRRECRSWSDIAAQLDMVLGPVIGEAQRIRKELRAQAKPTGSGDGRSASEEPGRRRQ